MKQTMQFEQINQLAELLIKDGGPNRVMDHKALELEAALTKSAFGHEYALMNLTDYTPFSKKQEILAQLEEHKKVYFWAREQLMEMNPEKLLTIEENLRYQKEFILRGNCNLH